MVHDIVVDHNAINHHGNRANRYIVYLACHLHRSKFSGIFCQFDVHLMISLRFFLWNKSVSIIR